MDKNMIFGRHPVLDAIKNGKNLEKVFLQKGVQPDFEREIRYFCRQNDIPLQSVPREKMTRLTRSNHQGVIGYLSLIKYYRLEDLLPHIYEQSEVPLFLILDGVTDVRNFGAIARSAEVCGVHAIVIFKKRSAQINADALKTSAGALTKIPVCREEDIIEAIKLLQQSGVQVLASDLKATKPIFQLDLTAPTALVVGSEDRGIQTKVANQVDDIFIIPQKGETDSFNVSVAAGIMVYEALRQRF